MTIGKTRLTAIVWHKQTYEIPNGRNETDAYSGTNNLWYDKSVSHTEKDKLLNVMHKSLAIFPVIGFTSGSIIQ